MEEYKSLSWPLYKHMWEIGLLILKLLWKYKTKYYKLYYNFCVYKFNVFRIREMYVSRSFLIFPAKAR